MSSLPYPTPLNAAVSLRMRRNRKRDTRPEIELRSELHARGARFRTNLLVRVDGLSVRPDIVFTHSPADYMLDHEMTSTIVRAAAFAAPIPNFLADRSAGPVLAGIPHLYYCDPIEGKDPLGREVLPGFRIDISNVIDAKIAMLAAHASQRDWLLKHHGMDQYVEAMKEWCAKRGGDAHVAFAEGFRQHLGHSYPQDNIVGELLGTC